jgi:hypothetical protein
MSNYSSFPTEGLPKIPITILIFVIFSEKSRRQSKILSETLNPIWDEHFFYEDLDEVGFAGRVLEAK